MSFASDTTVLMGIAGLSLAVWIYLSLFRGGFWRADQRIGDGAIEPPAQWPDIVAIIPARNEADVIGATVDSLLKQDYPKPFPIVLIDDRSDDGTAEAARAATTDQAERLHIVTGSSLPDGWAGKVWAMSQGVSRASEIAPGADFYLFCDADIVHDGSNLRRLAAQAAQGNSDLTSIMVKLDARGFWERFLIPPFVFFFQMLYPFAHVNRGRCFAAAGGCMLVRRQALEAAGGLAGIHDTLIDDCALAALLGRNGCTLWLGLSSQTRSARAYGGLSGVWNMVARTAYTQLNYSPFNLVGAVLGMFLVYLVPPLLLIGYGLHHDPATALLGGAAYGLMIGVYSPTLRFYEGPRTAALFLPIAALLYTAMTVDSAWRHWRGVGGGWKGRVYSR